MNNTHPLAQFSAFVDSQPEVPFLHQPIDRKLKVFTWAEVDNEARRMATALLGLGLVKGDKVGILSKNCAHWFISDLAIMMAGLVSVPIYPTAGRDTIQFVIEQSECKAIFVGKLDSLDEADAGIAPDIKRITYPYPTVKGQHQWDELIKAKPLKIINQPKLSDTFSLCYTSGSTGNPKGVVLSYGNVSSAATAYVNLMQVTTQDVTMSYLPLAHITERTLIEVLSYYSGNKIFFVESLDTFIDDVKVAQPTSFLSVPRLWNKFQIEILNNIPDKKLQTLLKIPLIGKLIAKKIRKGLGLGNATMFGSGTAPISPSILQWYDRIGIPISEGWGMTETSGLACSNMPYDAALLGSIGKACECVEMKIGDNQEILIRGPAVFKEYYKRPDATAESFTDGWFHTGDMGTVTQDGVYQIIGRLKEQFKTGKGKYVVPAVIETLLSHSKNIEQVCVMGQGRKQPIAVVVLSQPSSSQSASMTEKLEKVLSRVNAQLESHQKLDHIIVLKEEWTIDNGLLTPTMKVKRNEIENKYSHYLDQELTENIIWE
ncbi:AMP-binding protein [Marinicella rhabdoformis]|uniref:AMP-binding protein n=1 Tax=Marinicella rhabdoformis TaxID=2580566 RepID=UPI0012AEC372|nr:AMP-binding protein [Marinicella rhabdoformis]